MGSPRALMEGWKETYLRLFAANDAGYVFLSFIHTVTTVPSVRAFPSFIVFRLEQRQTKLSCSWRITQSIHRTVATVVTVDGLFR